MDKRIIIIGGLLMSLITQVLPALDTGKIAITINDTLSDDTVYIQWHRDLSIGKMREMGINTLQVSIVNNSAEPITITSWDGIRDIDPLSAKVIENKLEIELLSAKVMGNKLCEVPRLSNLAMASVGVLFFVHLFAIDKWWPQHRDDYTYKMPGTIVAILFSVLWGLGKLMDYIFVQIARNSLFGAVTVQPGNTVKKFIFVDKNKRLPKAYMCHVTDAQGQGYDIYADRVSVG